MVLEKILEAGEERDNRGWDCWMALPTQWTWIGSWWWTGRPGVLQSMGPQRLGHDWVTELNWCKELTHWKRVWCWARLKVGGEGDDRGWDGSMASPTQWTWVEQAPGVGDGQGSLACCSPWGHKESDMTEQLNRTDTPTSNKWWFRLVHILPHQYLVKIASSNRYEVVSHWGFNLHFPVTNDIECVFLYYCLYVYLLLWIIFLILLLILNQDAYLFIVGS